MCKILKFIKQVFMINMMENNGYQNRNLNRILSGESCKILPNNLFCKNTFKSLIVCFTQISRIVMSIYNWQ